MAIFRPSSVLIRPVGSDQSRLVLIRRGASQNRPKVRTRTGRGPAQERPRSGLEFGRVPIQDRLKSIRLRIGQGPPNFGPDPSRRFGPVPFRIDPSYLGPTHPL